MYGKGVNTDGEMRPDAPPAALLDDARRTIGRDILAGDSGVSALARYAAHVDDRLRRLYEAAGPSGRSVALIAIGGYGRRHLCPFSDIDLLVVFDGAVDDGEERFLRRLLHPLWDAGFVVGHQVRDAAELAQLEVDNPEFLLALMDARLVTGDAALFERLRESFHVPRTHAHVLGALQELIDARHAQFNATLYQLEPDVKDAPGALRDIAAARTVAPSPIRRCCGARCLRGWRRPRTSCSACDRSCTSSAAATTTCSGTSCRRSWPACSAIPASPGQRVEALMADYFRHARGVARAARSRPPHRAGARAPNLGRAHDGVRFIDARKAAIQPATWLAAFQTAHRRRDAGRRRDARRHPAARRSVFDRRFPADARSIATRCCGSWRRGPASTRGCRRCTTAACSPGWSRRSRRSPAAWSATSTTSTRSTSTRC